SSPGHRGRSPRPAGRSARHGPSRAGALLAALPWLLLALPAQCAAAGCAGSPPRGWLLLVALPPAAGVLVAWRCRRAGYAPRAALTRQSPRQARGPERLPALARWQWIAAMGAQRGRAGAWMLAPWLLLIPAGISRVALLVALAVALVLGAMLTAIGSSLRT